MSARTGTLLPHALHDARRRFGNTVLFDYHSRSRLSNVFEVKGTPLVIRLYGADDGQRVDVVAVHGYGETEIRQQFKHNGNPAFVDAGQNSYVLRTAGRYRLELRGEPGTVTVTYEPQLADSDAEIPQPSGKQAQRPNLFLNGTKLSRETKIIEITNRPWVFNAYGLDESDYIEVWSTYGYGATFREEPYLINDSPVWLTANANSLTLDKSGRYRFKLVGELDNRLLVGNPTAYVGGTGEPGPVIVGPPGPEGPAGPAGPAGVAQGYEHEQTTPATTWLINHNLGFRPSVELRTVGGAEFDAEVTHMSTNQLIVNTTVPMAGTARLI